jgi:uncharacterized membrane protein YraQ (UPF0718 family)
MTNYIIYGITFICLCLSFIKDKHKTKKALKKALKAFENILPQFIGIILLVGILLAFFNENVISDLIGESSGIIGIFASLAIGSVTLIPGFVAFPTAALLLDNGAGLTQIAAFISSLMMVGVVTIPLEKKFFNTKVTILRNVSAVIFSFFVAIMIGVIV